ncbi:MAG: GNAT family N-acetyltransferase [Bdellovibrionia bacterium]
MNLTITVITDENLRELDKLALEILNLQENLIFEKSEYSDGVNSGFLISKFDLPELTKIVTEKKGVLFCALGIEGEVLGYCLTSAITEFQDLYHGQSAVGRVELTIDSSLALKPRYLYQIAVRSDLRRSGVGIELLLAVKDKYPEGILTDILVSPINNEASLNFFRKQDFKMVGHLFLDSYRDFGQLVSEVFLWSTS